MRRQKAGKGDICENAAMIIVSAIMGFLVLRIVLTIGGSMNRRCEAETILPSAMEKTIEE